MQHKTRLKFVQVSDISVGYTNSPMTTGLLEILITDGHVKLAISAQAHPQPTLTPFIKTRGLTLQMDTQQLITSTAPIPKILRFVRKKRYLRAS